MCFIPLNDVFYFKIYKNVSVKFAMKAIAFKQKHFRRLSKLGGVPRRRKEKK